MDPRDDDSDELLDTASVSQESNTVPPILASGASTKPKLCGSCFLSESTTVAEVLCLSIIVAFILALFSAPIFIHFFVS